MTDVRADSIDADGRIWRQALGIIAVSTLVRLALAAVVPLFPDEAYYWTWSRRLAGGYFDHPPMIALLIAGGTALFGDTPFGVRVLPNLAGAAAAFAIARAAGALAGARSARFAALTFALFPMTAAGLVLATPDVPLLAGIAWTLYALVRALEEPVASASSTRWWLLAGTAIGLAMASKFTGVLVPAALLIAMAAHPPLRTRFREPGPWLAVALASLIMAPVLLWNAQHDWIAFRFQLGHGLGVSLRETWVTRELRLIGGQLGLVTPILFVLLVGAVATGLRRPREDRRFPLAAITTFCACFFVFSATRRSVEANWPAIAWLPAIILLASARGATRTVWERRALWFAGGLSALVLLQVVVPYLPLPARRDPMALAHGWDGLARSVHAARRTLAARPDGAAQRPDLFVATQRYQDASLLAFHLPDRPDVSALNLAGRRNQFDLWPRFVDRAAVGATLLLALELPREGRPGPIRRLDGHFERILEGPIVPLLRQDAEVGRRQLWFLSGWRGTWPVDSTATFLPIIR